MSNKENTKIIEHAKENGLICECNGHYGHTCPGDIHTLKCCGCGKPTLAVYLNNLPEA